MALEPLQLPPQFPCWVKAVYSWGGESKRDLGFVEGDLIECLNAGDGSWWMGRLRRDRRMMGLFPSNFVELVPDPQLSRNATPSEAQSRNTPTSRRGSRDLLSNTPDKKATPPSQKAFRKPFQAYNKLGPPGSKASTPPSGVSPQPSRTYRKPFQSYSRAVSPNAAAIAEAVNRQHSITDVPDLPPSAHRRSLQASQYEVSRPVSRQMSFAQSDDSPTRRPSKAPQATRAESPPPPPPPPHRVGVKSRVPSARPSFDNSGHPQHISRAPSPAPSISALSLTPSPLRDAMNDVMSSLNGMEMGQQHEPRTTAEVEVPSTPFSPEEFDMAFERSARDQQRRPRSSMGFGENHRQDYFSQSAYAAPPKPTSSYYDGDEQNFQNSRNSQYQQQSQSAPSVYQSMGPPAAPQWDRSPEHHNDITRNSTISSSRSSKGSRKLRGRRSAYELGRQIVNRTFTTKSSATSSSSGLRSDYTNMSASTEATSRSLMSGHSAGVFSATSAGSLARKRFVNGVPQSYEQSLPDRTSSRRPSLGSREISYVSTQSSDTAAESVYSTTLTNGNLVKKRKSGFFSKIKDAARVSTASVRQTMESPTKSRPGTPSTPKTGFGNDFKGISNMPQPSPKPTESHVDWMQVRRDINRSNTLSKNERRDRQERAHMNDIPVIFPVEDLYATLEGDEDMHGQPVSNAADLSAAAANLNLVDRAVRLLADLPSTVTPASLAANYLCRPYRSDVQKARAIFTWVAERIAFEEPYEGLAFDLRRAVHERRATPEVAAVMVMEMCNAVGLHCEVVQGYLKKPGMQHITYEPTGSECAHFWNAMLIDGEWRMVDASLASATNPARKLVSSSTAATADRFYFATLPQELAYTHVPLYDQQQHLIPPIHRETLLALPPASAAYFTNGLRLLDYDTSATYSEDLEMTQIEIAVPHDVELLAAVESKSYTRDPDGDYYENGTVTTTPTLAQAEWRQGAKRYRVKAVLPGDERAGCLKIYAGKRGLMHSIRDNVHDLALTLPLSHVGKNPGYGFVVRHPTPHALRQDVYIVQPQVGSLAMGSTYVFSIRQHQSLGRSAASPTGAADIARAASPSPFARPSSAMSLASSSAQGSSYSDQASSQGGGMEQQAPQKPAKLAIQAPGGKILRLQRKGSVVAVVPGEQADGTSWEVVVKVGERGFWRGLVLADRSARWCVFGEWQCR